MKRTHLLLTIILNLSALIFLTAQPIVSPRNNQLTENNTITSEIHTPGEFEPQDAVWLAWPAYDYEDSLPMKEMTAEIIRALKPYVPVKLLVADTDWQAIVDSTLQAMSVPLDHLTYVVIPYDEPWLRDMGPVFVIADGESKEMVDFDFNGWGNYSTQDFYPRLEEPVDRLIAEWMNIKNNMTRLVGEGGNREFNGEGIMMCVAPTELQRNPNMTLDEIEAEFQRLFGIEKVIWLPHSLYDDSLAPTIYPGPNGEKAYGYGVAHIDELARFVGHNTIVLSEVSESEALLDTFALVNRDRLEENYDILRQATDVNGDSFHIIRIPAAMTEYMQLTEDDYSYIISTDITHEDGIKGHTGPIWWVPAKSYANFLITNGAVLVPQYWRPGRPQLEKEKDSIAVEVLQTVFPNRDILTFAPDLSIAVNAGGGGIHCITAQEPTISSSTSNDFDEKLLEGKLYQNYPNPFSSTTSIQIELAEPNFISMQVFNLNGQLIRTIVSEKLSAGKYDFIWDGKDQNGQSVASGVYFSQISGRELSGETEWKQTIRMIFMK